MDTYLFNHEKWLQHYNCSFFDVDQISLEKRQHPFIGSTILGLAVIFEILYVPCLISIHKHSHLSCYNLMRFIGVMDIVVIPLSGIFMGIALTRGWVYCSYPTLFYWTGKVATDSWAVVAFSSLILAFNRCVEMYSSDLGTKLFGGWKIYVWQMLPILYGLYFFMFVQPVLLSSVLSSWFFNPYMGYYKDCVNYVQPMHSFNNTATAIGLPVLYIAFFVAWKVRSSFDKKGDVREERASSHQYGIFVQVLMISTVNVTGCIIYIYMQISELNVVLIVVSSYIWLLMHGTPVVVYLCLNKTIRRDCLAMLRLTKSASPPSSTVPNKKGSARAQVQPLF